MNPLFEQYSVQELLEITYKQYDIPAGGGQDKQQVKIVLSPYIYFYIPNLQVRKNVVLKHDAHHLITGTPFTFIGETEIAIWEIAGGCYRHWFALLINSTTIPFGLVFNFKNLFAACKKGYRSQSLYDNRFKDEDVLKMNTAKLFKDIGMDKIEQDASTTFVDILVFVFWVSICLFINLLGIIIIPFLLLYNVYIFAVVKPTK